MGILVGIGLLAQTSWADVQAISMASYSFHSANNAHFSIGYTFTLTQPTTVTALGALDFLGTSIGSTQSFPVAIYYSAVTPNAGTTAENGHLSGTAVPGASALVASTDPILALNGGAYTGGDGFRYHTLASPITLDAATYEIQSANMGTGYASNWTAQVNAPGVTAPQMGTFSSTPTDSASYQIDIAPESFRPSVAGPNFLIAVPEPETIGVLSIVGLGVFGRRRR
jgi:hypothetical protein